MTTPIDDSKPTWTDPAPTTTTALPPTTALLAPPVAAPVNAEAPAAVAPVVIATKKSGGWVNLLLGLAAVIAVGGVAFAIGRSTAPVSAASVGTFPGGNDGIVLTPGGSFDPNGGPAGNGGPRGLFGTGGPTIDGTVASIDGDTMTITLPSGDTMTVKTDGTTTYHESTAATAADVKVGDDVAVRVSGGLRFDANSGSGRGTNGNGGTDPNGANEATDGLTATDVTVTR